MSYDVAVVGAGAVGLATAHYLAEAGHDTVVVDAGEPGGEVSAGNAGEILPDTIAPLPAPGVVRMGMKNMLGRDSSLYINPANAVPNLNFLRKFVRYSTTKSYQAGKQNLLKFARGTHQMFDELAEGGHIDPPEYKDYLFVYESGQKAELALKKFESNFSVPTTGLMDGGALRAAEPSLGEAASGGFGFSGSSYLDPYQFCLSLAASLQDRGVTVTSHFPVEQVQRRSAGVALSGRAGTVQARKVVVAAGVGTPALAKFLSQRNLPIYPGKGYSFTLPGDPEFTHVVKLMNVFVGVIPLGQGVRVAGTMEFDGHNPRYNERRVKAIVEGARPYLSQGFQWDAAADHWVGSRPMSADGLPLVGELPGFPEVIIAAGHNMHGIMLAPRTGEAVAELATSGKAPNHIRPFSLNRF